MLTENVLNGSGLGMITKDELERAMAGKNTSTTFSIEEDGFLFKGETVSNEVTLLFQLLYAHIMDPGFRKDAYELSLKRYRQKYMALSRSIDGAMALSGRRFLAGGDQRFGLPDDEEFKKLSLDDIKSWISPFIGNNDIEISVVGDVNTHSVIQLAAQYFGSLTLYPAVSSNHFCSDKYFKRAHYCCLSNGRYLEYPPDASVIYVVGYYLRQIPRTDTRKTGFRIFHLCF